MTTGVAGMLADVVASDALLRDEERERWAVGGVVPEVVAFPGTAEEAGRILARASEEGWTVVPAGRGRRLGGSGPPDGVDVVLSTRRMDRILHYEAADLTVSLEAGLEVERLRSRLDEERQWLPLDPPGAAGGSVGALLATGRAGPLGAGFGRPRDLVLGGTLVTGDGRVLDLGGRVVKNVAGFDLLRLAVGSGGALGVLTGATLRLFPRPERDVTLRLEAGEAEDLVEAARRVATAPLPLAAVELVDPAPRSLGSDEGGGAALLVRIVGGSDAVESVAERVGEALGGSGAHGLHRLEGARSAAAERELERLEDGAALVARLALLPARLGETVARARELVAGAGGSAGAGSRVAAHVTTGIVRVVVPGPVPSGAVAGWAERLEALRGEMEAEGGSLTLSSAPPELARSVGARGDAGEVERLLEELKQAFDPAGVMPRVGC